MKTCRACLLVDNKCMIPLDELFVNNYNLMTNLNVMLCDDLPQYLCLNCAEILKVFIEFRAKAIATENTLRELAEDIKPLTLNSHQKLEGNGSPKHEIKVEETNDSDILYEFIENNLNEGDNIQCEFTDPDTAKFEEKVIVKKDQNLSCEPKTAKRTKRKAAGNSKSCNKLVSTKEKSKKKNVADKCFSCGLCERQFEEKTARNTHLTTHKQFMKCDICSERFTSWAQMIGHRIQHLLKHERRCHDCNKYCATSPGLQYHYLCAHSGEQNTSLKCKYCSKWYQTPTKLQKHITRTHSENRAVFTCDYCSKKISNKGFLRRHIIAHMNVKPYSCKLCDFKTNFRSGINDHMVRKHTPEKVTCKKCLNIFKNEKCFDEHKCSVKLYICSICGKEFDERRTRYNKHMATHEPPRHKCPRCPKAFWSREALKCHVDRHDGTPAYRCDFCPARFYAASSRNRHHRTHTGEKPYVCKVCNKAFMSNSILKMHLKVHGIFVIKHRTKEPEDVK